MSDDHPNPPDTSELWDDDANGVLATQAARQIFLITFAGVVVFSVAAFVILMM